MRSSCKQNLNPLNEGGKPGVPGAPGLGEGAEPAGADKAKASETPTWRIKASGHRWGAEAYRGMGLVTRQRQ